MSGKVHTYGQNKGRLVCLFTFLKGSEVVKTIKCCGKKNMIQSLKGMGKVENKGWVNVDKKRQEKREN